MAIHIYKTTKASIDFSFSDFEMLCIYFSQRGFIEI